MAARTYRLHDNGVKMIVIDEFHHNMEVAWYDRNMKLGFIQLTIGAQEYKREGNWRNAVLKKFSV